MNSSWIDLNNSPTLPSAVMSWHDVPGWFRWRSGQEEAVAHFPEGSRFVEVGLYLGRSICSLADVTRTAGKQFCLIGVDTCQGSGEEGKMGKDYHCAAVREGGGTLAGQLHRNILQCGFGDSLTIFIASSHRAAELFAEQSLDWVHLDARHDYDNVKADIAAWLPKVRSGGWLSGDDFGDEKWPGVTAAVLESLPGASEWSDGQWRWVVA
jgi:hypothetical protein